MSIPIKRLKYLLYSIYDNDIKLLKLIESDCIKYPANIHLQNYYYKQLFNKGYYNIIIHRYNKKYYNEDFNTMKYVQLSKDYLNMKYLGNSPNFPIHLYKPTSYGSIFFKLLIGFSAVYGLYTLYNYSSKLLC